MEELINVEFIEDFDKRSSYDKNMITIEQEKGDSER